MNHMFFYLWTSRSFINIYKMKLITQDDTHYNISSPVSVAASAPKVLKVSPDMVLTEDDHDITLDCLMTGNLAPDLTWLHKGRLTNPTVVSTTFNLTLFY